MLKLMIPAEEYFDEITSQFHNVKEQVLHLEHSLVSISKWESIWHKPFISKNDMTLQETTSYVECMCLDHNVDPFVFRVLTQDHILAVSKYISNPMSATIIYKKKEDDGRFKETVTSELIYSWMTLLTIPWTADKWHLNRLLNLITILELKNNPKKKMSPAQIAASNREENERRLKLYGTNG